MHVRRRHDAARRARGELAWAIGLTYISLALLAAAVGVAWYSDDDPIARIKVAYEAGTEEPKEVCAIGRPAGHCATYIGCRFPLIPPRGGDAKSPLDSDATGVFW